MQEIFEGNIFSIKLIDFQDDTSLYFEEKIARYGDSFINNRHFYVQYLKRLKAACMESRYNLTPLHFKKLIDLIHLKRYALTNPKSSERLENYLHEMNCIPQLPDELKSPEITFSLKMFQINPPAKIRKGEGFSRNGK